MDGRNDPISELVRLLGRLPGIGERTATRLAFFVLGEEPEYAAALGEALGHIHERVRRCEVCGNYTAEPRCRICRDERRDATVLCAVGHVPELWAIERSGTFRGRYHVLHALLAPLEGIGPEQLPLDALLDRVKREGTREVIVATPLSVEGEATALYLAEALHPLGIQISRIASGVPHGGELEYTDQVTLARALSHRHQI